MHFGATEILIIVLIVLVLFGGKRIPGLARSIGASIRNFRSGISEAGNSDEKPDEK